jgi:hypothetical protein
MTGTLMTGTLMALMAQTSASADAPEVPESLRVPADQVLAVAARGVGVQIYECTVSKDDSTHAQWTLKGPEAVLRRPSGAPVGKHYAGPTWEANDGSKVVGEVTEKRDAPEGNAIPWLLLRAKSTSGSGIFGRISYIQRLNTVGGIAPSAGCDSARVGAQVRISYQAEYRFFTSREGP